MKSVSLPPDRWESILQLAHEIEVELAKKPTRTRYSIIGNPNDPDEQCVIGVFETKEEAEVIAAELYLKYDAGISVVPYFEEGVVLWPTS